MLLSRVEELYLAVIVELKGDAYGVPIRKAILEKMGKRISYGALYFALDQLVKKGLIEKRADDPTPVRGGRTKFIFSLTESGKQAVRETYIHQQSLWKSLKEVFE